MAACTYDRIVPTQRNPRRVGAVGGEWLANKILFGTQMCTYNPCRGNERKGIGVSGRSKPGLTRHAIETHGWVGWFSAGGSPLRRAFPFWKSCLLSWDCECLSRSEY